jgi:hypothetical protein
MTYTESRYLIYLEKCLCRIVEVPIRAYELIGPEGAPGLA